MKVPAWFVVLCGVLATLAPAPALADQEQQIGQQVYQELARKGEIIPQSPLYSVLGPVGERIAAVTGPQYPYPFRFILVHEKDPNAFSVPGGNVYVTDSLLHFVDNKEELAGVLCHETSHTIHRDVVNLMNKDRNAEILGSLAQIFLSRGSYLAGSAIGLGTNLQEEHFSRSVETAADLKGSETCAQAGFNPYGLVWLFKKFAKSGKGGTMEILSDHPSDGHRVAAVETHIHDDPALFGRFSDDISKATPIKLPAEETPGAGRYPPPGSAPGGAPRQGAPPQNGPPQPAPTPAPSATPQYSTPP